MPNLANAQGALQFAEQQRSEMVRCWQRHRRFEVNGVSQLAYALAKHSVMRVGPPGDPASWVSGRTYDRITPVRMSWPEDLMAVLRARIPYDDWQCHEMQKEMYSFALHHFMKLTKAIGCLFMTEAWYVDPAPSDPHDLEKSWRDVEEWRKTQPRSVEHWEGRKEGLYMSLEHVELSAPRVWMAEITREPDRLHPWTSRAPTAVAGLVVEGRFANFVDARS